MHIGTCLSCARAAQVKAGPSCHCKCLSFSRQLMCRIGKSAAQTVQDLQTVYGDYAVQKNRCVCMCLSDTAISKVGNNTWEMSLAVGDLEL